MTNDAPVPFGYKMAWLAIHSQNTFAIINALQLSESRLSGWTEGINVVYEDIAGNYIFVTPPIGAWTLVVGNWTGGWGEGLMGAEKLICRLSTQFGQAQAFSTDRVTDYHHWMLALDGQLLRSFAYHDSRILTDKGTPTSVEQLLGLCSPEHDSPFARKHNQYRSPNESDVMTVAGDWSINPSELDAGVPSPGPGVLAKSPRNERSRD